MNDLFPARAHRLVLASDPDGLLDDEETRGQLVARGFRIVYQEDNVRLWLAADALRPWTAEQPVLVITRRPLNELPYDLWEQGHHVSLSLAEFFPRFSLPVVRELTPGQRDMLAQAEQPARRLGQRTTIAHVLERVFDADVAALGSPGGLLLWLNDVHSGLGPLPESVLNW